MLFFPIMWREILIQQWYETITSVTTGVMWNYHYLECFSSQQWYEIIYLWLWAMLSRCILSCSLSAMDFSVSLLNSPWVSGLLDCALRLIDLRVPLFLTGDVSVSSPVLPTDRFDKFSVDLLVSMCLMSTGESILGELQGEH